MCAGYASSFSALSIGQPQWSSTAPVTSALPAPHTGITNNSLPQATRRRIGSSSHNALHLNYIIVFFFNHVTIPFAMDFIEVVSQTAPTFRERKLIYLHCFDLGAQESVQLEQFPCLQVKLVLGHVSFPDKIAERRMCGFLFEEKVINLLKDRPSPVLLEVTNSCNIKVSFSAFSFLGFGI